MMFGFPYQRTNEHNPFIKHVTSGEHLERQGRAGTEGFSDHIHTVMVVSPNGWFIKETPRIDNLGVPPFWETSSWLFTKYKWFEFVINGMLHSTHGIRST